MVSDSDCRFVFLRFREAISDSRARILAADCSRRTRSGLEWLDSWVRRSVTVSLRLVRSSFRESISARAFSRSWFLRFRSADSSSLSWCVLECRSRRASKSFWRIPAHLWRSAFSDFRKLSLACHSFSRSLASASWRWRFSMVESSYETVSRGEQIKVLIADLSR